jgi:UDPglucose--hexose-1-phosphate uridylyltransferase
MSELRHDALTGRQVLVSPGRAARPHTTAGATPADRAPADCPFCPGHEHETPPEVARSGPGAPDTPGWAIRVVGNLYPIVGGTGTEVTGAHEVLVLSPGHDRPFEALSDAEAVDVVTMLRARARHHAARAHVQLFVNQGRAAGASIAHPHAQLVALDFVPPAVRAGIRRFAAADADLLLADLAAAERAGTVLPGNVRPGNGSADATPVRAWCPLAAATPYEIRLATLDGGPDFAAVDDRSRRALALTLRDVLRAAATVLGGPAYNVVFHDAPADATYHWWIEVVPRLVVLAGFELGTGILVNVIDPVQAAEVLGETLAGDGTG